MKRAFNYLVIVISVAVLGVVLWSTSFFGVAKADVAFVAVQRSPSKELFSEAHLKANHSAYPGIDIVTVITEAPTHHQVIHYPKFKNERLNHVIHAYISIAKQEFLAEVELNKEYLHEASASLYVLFDIHLIAPDLYSIVFSKESYVSGANGDQSAYPLIVDLKHNRLVSQTEIIDDNVQNRDQIYHVLAEGFTQSEQYQDFFFADKLKDWIEDDQLTFSNVYLTEQELVFTFNKYQVTAGAVGAPEIAIALTEMTDVLTDEWLEILNLKQTDQNQDIDVEQETDQATETVKQAETNQKRVALTFDDGPHPTHTLEILSLLDTYQAKATFFVLGNRVDFYPGIIQEMAEKGHEIGNHTWNHKDLTTLSGKQLVQEIETTNQAIETLIREPLTIYRPPYGAINDHVCATVDLTPVMWTLDPKDWKSLDSAKVFNHVKATVEDGSIIILHDIHASTVEAVELILAYLTEEDYQMVTVSELEG